MLLGCSAEDAAALRRKAGNSVTDSASRGAAILIVAALRGMVVAPSTTGAARACRVRRRGGDPSRGIIVKTLLRRYKTLSISGRKGGLPGPRKRAFYATGFEKRTSQPELWAFLHCASTRLV